MGRKILSVFLALTLCLGLLPAQALAAETADTDEPITEDAAVVEEQTAPETGTAREPESSDEAELENPVYIEAMEEAQADLEAESKATLYASTVAYPVEGGYLYFDPTTGTITDCSTRVTSVVIPDSINGVAVTSIADQAFYNCSKLTSIVIPGSVTSIGTYVFYGCSGLTSAGPIGGGYSYEFGWTESIPRCAFTHCSGLTSIVIPDGITNIGRSAFAKCSGLTSVFIPDSLTSIENSAFSDCSGLTSIFIPDSVTSMGEYTFAGCTGLTSIVIPDSVTSIGNYMFHSCSRLTSIFIPDSVTSIGNYATYGCNGLTDVYYAGSEAAWNKIYLGYPNFNLTGATIHYNGIKFSIGSPYSIKVGNFGRSYAPVPDKLKGNELSWKWESSDSSIVSFSKNGILGEMTGEGNPHNTISELFCARAVGRATLTCSIDGNIIYRQEVIVEAPDSTQPTIESNDYEVPQDAAKKFEKSYNKLEAEYKKFMDGIQDILDHPGKYAESVTDPTVAEQARAVLEHDKDSKTKEKFLLFSPISTPDEVKLCCYEVFCEQLYDSTKEVITPAKKARKRRKDVVE